MRTSVTSTSLSSLTRAELQLGSVVRPKRMPRTADRVFVASFLPLPRELLADEGSKARRNATSRRCRNASARRGSVSLVEMTWNASGAASDVASNTDSARASVGSENVAGEADGSSGGRRSCAMYGEQKPHSPLWAEAHEALLKLAQPSRQRLRLLQEDLRDTFEDARDAHHVLRLEDCARREERDGADGEEDEALQGRRKRRFREDGGRVEDVAERLQLCATSLSEVRSAQAEPVLLTCRASPLSTLAFFPAKPSVPPSCAEPISSRAHSLSLSSFNTSSKSLRSSASASAFLGEDEYDEDETNDPSAVIVLRSLAADIDAERLSDEL